MPGAAAHSAAGCPRGYRPDTRHHRAPRAADDSGHTASAPTRLHPHKQVRRADHLHSRIAPTPTHILRTGPTRTRRSRRYNRTAPARRQPARPHRLDSQSKARTHAGSRLWQRHGAAPSRQAQRSDRRPLEGGRHVSENLDADRDAPLVHDKGWLMNVRADLTWGSHTEAPQGPWNLPQHPGEVLPTK